MNKVNEAFEKWWKGYFELQKMPGHIARDTWQACMEHYGINLEPTPMTRERILAMKPGELRERAAVDVMGWGVEITTASHGKMYTGTITKDGWKPDEDWEHLGMVIEAMRERNLHLDTWLNMAGTRSVRFVAHGTAPNRMDHVDGSEANFKDLIIIAALCAEHGV